MYRKLLIISISLEALILMPLSLITVSALTLELVYLVGTSNLLAAKRSLFLSCSQFHANKTIENDMNDIFVFVNVLVVEHVNLT